MSVPVAVVVPIFKTELSADERLSLAQLSRWLGGYPRVQVSPASLTADLVGGEVRRFPDDFFTGTGAYSRLLLSREFYEAFLDFDYILVHQTDCLTFSDTLEDFVQLGVDYLGAPWVLFDRSAGPRLGRAGNGGFSLRRVKRFLDVLQTSAVFSYPGDELRRHFGPMRFFSRLDAFRIRAFAACRLPQLGETVARKWTGNEDIFWAFMAPAIVRDFRVADWQLGVRFAFEEAPQLYYSLNQGRLPFACHAWKRWDLEFWQGILDRLES
jgi:hypothetical protein